VSLKEASFFVALRYRDFRWLWLGQLVSESGTQMQVVAVNWHIYLLTSSPIALGFIGLFRVAPIIIFSLIGGIYADAFDRKRIMLVSQGTMMVVALSFFLLTLTGGISVCLIYLLTALTAAASAFDGPAWQSIVPNLVPREHLSNALSLNNVMRHTARVLGPAAGGLVIARFGVVACYLANALSFVAVILAVWYIKSPVQEKLGVAKFSFPALKEGISFVFRTPLLKSTILLDFFSTFFSSASSLLPIFAKDILRVGAQGLGFLHAAESVGAVLAGFALSLMGSIRKQGGLLLVALFLYGGATCLFGLSRWFELSLFALALAGGADTVSAIMRQNIRQLNTPDYLRGRMTSIARIFSNGGPQLGNLEAGLVAALIGAPLSVITGSVATMMLVIFVALRVPELRKPVV